MVSRAPVHDMDSSTSSVELDASFQRNLERKRLVTNKENSRPSNAITNTLASRAALNDRSGMPLGEIGFDPSIEPIRNIPHWILEESCVYTAKDSLSFSAERSSANKSEYSEINRLLANCDINIVESSTTTTGSGCQSDKHALSKSNAVNESAESIVDDSFEIKKDLNNECTDDTLEEIEYVNYGDGLHYVPVKNMKKTVKKMESADYNYTQNDESSNCDDFILIDSSPENSFTTAKNNMDTKSMIITDESFVTTATMPDISVRTVNSTKSTGTEFYTMVDSCSTADSAKQSLQEQNKSININDNPPPSLNETFDEIPEFDTTLERIEYLMEKGQQLQAKSVSTVQTVITPKSISKAHSTDARRTPGNVQNQIQVSKNASPFKKPEYRASPRQHHHQSSSANKAASKIPTLRCGPSSATKLQFKHIASPVATYINKTAEVPLIKTVRHVNKNFNPNIYGKAVCGKEHDASVQSNKACGLSETGTKLSLPRKVFKAASHQKV